MEDNTNSNGTTQRGGVACPPFEVMQPCASPMIPLGRGVSVNGHFVAFAAGAGTVLLIMWLISKCNDK